MKGNIADIENVIDIHTHAGKFLANLQKEIYKLN